MSEVFTDERGGDHVDVPRSRSRHRHHAQCVVSHRLRWIYLAIAKNASTTVRALIEDLDADTVDLRCSEILPDIWHDYRVFTILRDPVSRALSAYCEVSDRAERGTGQRMPFQELPAGLGRFEAYLDCVETRAWDVHVRSQADLIGQHRVDSWGFFESLRGDIARIFEQSGHPVPETMPHLRQRHGIDHASHSLGESDLPAATIDRVRRMYREDIALLDAVRAAAKNASVVVDGWTKPVVRIQSRD